MRILHVVPSYLPATRYGGPIYSVHGLCKSLAARGHDVHVYTTSVDGPVDSDVPHGVPVNLEGVKIWYFQSRNLRRLYWAPQMARALKENLKDFDVVHIHSVFLWPTLAAARACWGAGVPYLLAPRGMLVPELIRRRGWLRKSLWIWLFERAHIERAAAVHLTSGIEEAELRRLRMSLPKVVRLPNGIQVAPIRQTERVPREPNVVLFLGRLNWKKGVDHLLRAMGHIAETQLWLAGNDEDGYLPELRALATELGLTARVRFLGPVVGPQKKELYRRATIFVLPSHSENFGNSVLEAMAEGCPVVISPHVGLAPAIQQSGAGLVCSNDPGTLAAAIKTLLMDESRRRSMGEVGERVAREGYGWDAIATRMESCYQNVLSRRVIGNS